MDGVHPNEAKTHKHRSKRQKREFKKTINKAPDPSFSVFVPQLV
jgi:hypothetical protein